MAVAAATVVVTEAVAFALAASTGATIPRTDGPLVVSKSPHSYVYLLDGPTTFTDGFDAVSVSGEDPITIESIRSLGNLPGVAFENVLISGIIGGDGTWQSFDHYPPSEHVATPIDQAVGKELPPGPGWYQLLLGYRADVQQPVAREGIEIIYTSAGTKYLARIPAGIVMCPASYEAECDATSESLVDSIG